MPLDETPEARVPGTSSGARRDAALSALAVAELDAPFRSAERRDCHESAWFGHVPFAHWLIGATHPRILVELGTHWGVSYAAFCQAIEAEGTGSRCFAVDTWQGDEHAGHYPEEVFQDVQRYNQARFSTFSQLLRCTFDEAVGMFADGSVDVLHIDGLHTYDAVRHDFENWLPKLSSRAVVLFHDTNERQRDFGVWRLWTELAAKWPAFEFVHGHGLGVLCVGTEAPEAIRSLSELPPREAAAVRARFAFLGERWETEARATALRRDLAARDTQIASLANAQEAALLAASAAHAHELELARNEAKAEARAAAEVLAQFKQQAAVQMQEQSQILARVRDQALVQAREATRDADLLRRENAALRQAQELAALERVRRKPEISIIDQVERVAQVSPETMALARTARTQAEMLLDQVVRERDALLLSTAWKATWPLRWLGASVPHPVRWHGRRAVKAAWWAMTPWHLPRRMEALRNRPAIGPADVIRSRPSSPPPAALLPPPAPVPVAPQPATPTALARDDPYARWIAEFEPRLASPAGVEAPRFFSEVRFTFLIPYADRPGALDATLASLRAQANPDWEVLVAFPERHAAECALGEAAADRRVVSIGCGESADRGGMLGHLLSSARGSWVGVLDGGDVLSPDALDEIARTLAQAPGLAIVYGDEDVLSEDGRRQAPLFKPGWSPEMLQAFNYFGRLTMFSRSRAIEAGGFVAGHGAGSEWSLNLRMADAAEGAAACIARIPRVLCHRAADSDRERPATASPAAAQHRDVLRAFWAGRGIASPRVETQPDGTQRSSWEMVSPPLVTVIVPNHNQPDLLRRCASGLLDGTTYRNVELVIVENRSDDPEIWALYATLGRRPNVRVIRHDAPFNYSAACNRGAEIANGELLLFLNNDIEVVDPGWLGELVRVVTLPGVGIAGTKLRYPTGELQHAGVAAGIHLYGLMFNRAQENDWGVFGSPNYTRNWLAIMGACQMVRREVFNRLGGFDEAYQIANSDVAFCLRAHKAGWRTAYTPFAGLLHHEGMTRGRTNPAADMAHSAREVHRLGIDEDPYLHPSLSGLDAVPRLRAPGEPSLRETFLADAARVIAAAPTSNSAFDPFDAADAEAASHLPGSDILWPPQRPDRVDDLWSAARWILDLLRSRPDLRTRFPHALSQRSGGPFASWLTDGGARELGLPPQTDIHLRSAFAANLSVRPRHAYLNRDDLRAAFPLGLLPPGRGGLSGWMLRYGRTDESLRPEEIWWFILACAENPEAELVLTYRFSPAWQHAHPYGLTVFGRDALAAWIAERYDLPWDTAWLNPSSWPTELTAADEIRLAYAARNAWRDAHPGAFETKERAQALLEWLAQPSAGLWPAQRDWCSARALDDTASALAAPGANVIGHFCYPSGLRVSVEAMSNAMETAGAAVSRRDMRTTRNDDPCHGKFGGLETHDVTIIHVQPDPFFDDVFQRSDLAPRQDPTYRVAYWYWELEAVPTHWAETARQVNEVWAATSFVADALRHTVPVPVHTLFPGVQIGRFSKRPREAFGLPDCHEGRFAFVFSFHMASIVERKNPLGLIQAFKQAFRFGEPVDLILKTTSASHHDDQMRELHEAAAGANVHILDRIMTPDETLSLIDACDAYVSLHRSEGLGLTMAEAMLLGKPVIATRYSGNLDFMDDGNSLLVDYELVPLGRPIPPYDAAARWAEPSLDHAAGLMRRLYEDRAWAAELGEKARADASARFSLAAAGERFIARLAAIKDSGRRGPARMK